MGPWLRVSSALEQTRELWVQLHKVSDLSTTPRQLLLGVQDIITVSMSKQILRVHA